MSSYAVQGGWWRSLPPSTNSRTWVATNPTVAYPTEQNARRAGWNDIIRDQYFAFLYPRPAAAAPPLPWRPAVPHANAPFGGTFGSMTQAAGLADLLRSREGPPQARLAGAMRAFIPEGLTGQQKTDALLAVLRRDSSSVVRAIGAEAAPLALANALPANKKQGILGGLRATLAGAAASLGSGFFGTHVVKGALEAGTRNIKYTPAPGLAALRSIGNDTAKALAQYDEVSGIEATTAAVELYVQIHHLRKLMDADSTKLDALLTSIQELLKRFVIWVSLNEDHRNAITLTKFALSQLGAGTIRGNSYTENADSDIKLDLKKDVKDVYALVQRVFQILDGLDGNPAVAAENLRVVFDYVKFLATAVKGAVVVEGANVRINPRTLNSIAKLCIADATSTEPALRELEDELGAVPELRAAIQRLASVLPRPVSAVRGENAAVPANNMGNVNISKNKSYLGLFARLADDGSAMVANSRIVAGMSPEELRVRNTRTVPRASESSALVPMIEGMVGRVKVIINAGTSVGRGAFAVAARGMERLGALRKVVQAKLVGDVEGAAEAEKEAAEAEEEEEEEFEDEGEMSPVSSRLVGIKRGRNNGYNGNSNSNAPPSPKRQEVYGIYTEEQALEGALEELNSLPAPAPPPAPNAPAAAPPNAPAAPPAANAPATGGGRRRKTKKVKKSKKAKKQTKKMARR